MHDNNTKLQATQVQSHVDLLAVEQKNITSMTKKLHCNGCRHFVEIISKQEVDVYIWADIITKGQSLKNI